MGYISIFTIGILACVLTTLPFIAFTQPWVGGRIPAISNSNNIISKHLTSHKGPLFVQNGGHMKNYFKQSRGLPYPPMKDNNNGMGLAPLEWELIKRGHECHSSDTKLGEVWTVSDCAHKCSITPGCKFFIVGNNGRWESCYQEHTYSADCVEGWDRDSYDFYQLKDKKPDIGNAIGNGIKKCCYCSLSAPAICAKSCCSGK